MDIHKAAEEIKNIDERIALAREYKESRESATKAKLELDTLLVANLCWIRAEKPNVGTDMAYLMLMEISKAAKEPYEKWLTELAKYKGLERIITAVESKTTFVQSLMRYQRDL